MFADLQIYLGVALAGLASFLSPCVLPLVPPYLGYIGGTTLEELQEPGEVDATVGQRVILASIFFVAGFTTVFLGLGASVSAFGALLQSYREPLGIVSGIIIILFGLHFLGIVRIPMLYQEARFEVASSSANYFGAYIMGLAFAFGWTPCIGPILMTVLAVATNEASLSAGLKLLLAYSLGLGVPFILAAVAIGPFLGFIKRFKRHFGLFEKVMGLVLVVTGILFLTGGQNWFSSWMLEHFPGLARIEDMVTPDTLKDAILKKGAQP